MISVKNLSTEKKVFYSLVGATILLGSVWTIRKIMEQKTITKSKK